jgi:nucleotide-binding universal stress UspA family protein
MAATLWAAAEAQRRGATLSLVHAYSTPPLASGPGFFLVNNASVVAVKLAEQLLDKAAAAARKAHPGMTVTTRVSNDSPASALQTASKNAVLTVVGSHGQHQLTEALLGSVAAAVTGQAHSPVVVIRTDPAGRPSGGEGPVVVGLDGSPESDDALEFALHEAATRRTALVAIRTWDDSALDGFQGGYPALIDRDEADAEELVHLTQQLARRTGNFPEVPVHPLVLRGRPATALLEFCEDPGSMGLPSLLVVGSRGRGRVAGMVMGSTSHALIARATFGVAVVRPDAA